MRRTRTSRNKSQCVKETEESRLKTVWQWRGDDGQWEAYSPSASAMLDSAVSSGQTSFTLTLDSGASYNVDLKKMVQINPVTKYKRKIRCQKVKQEVLNESSDLTVSHDTVVQIKEELKEEEREEEEKEQPAAKRKRSQKNEKTPDGETESDAVRTVVMKGKAPVDPECKSKVGKAHVYCEGSDVYDVMLNQTNLQFNNNKFYLIQLLQDDSSKVYSVWMRWGRVGQPGQNSLVACGSDLLKAKNVFKKKFSDKTKNEWEYRETFEKVPGKYDIVYMDYNTDEKKEEKLGSTSSTEVQKKPSRLNPKVQSLLQLICDLKALEECVLEMKFDTKKAPLGKLTSEQIRSGYTALKKIEECLKNKSSRKTLEDACNQFYTRIPHNFGLKRPPIIDSQAELKEKIALLEALSDIQIAVKMVRSSNDGDEHPLDRQYQNLHCGLQPLDSCTHEFKVIEQYLQSTHASTHNTYTMTVTDIFSVDRDRESANFLSQLHNRTLLWHGSRLSNWVGILSQGLRVAPPEAPVTGYMFGKGIYFADMSSKSANYCYPSQNNNVGLLLLCEVALGNSNELRDADYKAGELPTGTHSTKGLGRTGPDPKNSVTLDGVTVPMGPGVTTGATQSHSYSLLYNEFVVYDPAQTRMRYLLRIQFNFSRTLW